MLNFKKGYNLKIVSVVVAAVFLFTSTSYGIDLSDKTYLRNLLLFNKRVSDDGGERMEEAEEKVVANLHKASEGQSTTKHPFLSVSIKGKSTKDAARVRRLLEELSPLIPIEHA